MEILPKYKIGDELWTIDGCKAESFVVMAIVTQTTERGTTISYSSTANTTYCSVPEQFCFPSKEALIEQL